MAARFFKFIKPIKIITGYLLASLLIGSALAIPVVIMYKTIILSAEIIFILRILLICVFAGISFFLFGIIFLLIIVGVKRLLNLKSNLKDCTLSSFEFVKFEAYTSLLGLCQFFFLHLTRGTFIMNWFYRGMGAKIGKNTIINTTKLFDCNLIEIGDNCVIGGDCIINGHILEDGKLKKGMVIIGDGVTIGTCSLILPGVIIERNVIVGANSLVTKNKVLDSNSVYAGIPAQKLDERKISNKSGNRQDLESHSQLRKLKENLRHSEILLKLYERLSIEIVAFETLMANVFISSVGIIFSIIIYSVLNNAPSILLIIPPLIGIVSAFIVSTAASMLRAAFKKSQIEIFFQNAGVKYFNWETRYGELGKSRLTDLDGILIFIIFAILWLVGLIYTFNGKIIGKADLFLDYPVYKILVIINGGILLWVLICLIFSNIKSKYYKKQLKELRLELENIENTG